jgi:eukaryotic-like serine/threonine-protein kinase
VQVRRELADAHRRIGWQLAGTRDFEKGRDHFRQAIAIFTQLVAEDLRDLDSRMGLAGACNEFGSLLEYRGDLRGALENERRALVLLEEAPAEGRDNPRLRQTLSITHDYMGRALFLSGDVGAALQSNAKALDLRAALVSQDPANATFRRMLAISYQNDGDFRDHSGDSRGAVESFRRKLAIDEELLARDRANVQAHGDLAYSLLRLADIHAARGDHAEALLHYRRSVDVRQEVGTQSGDTTLDFRLAVSHAGIARAQASLGHRSAALDAARRAETIIARAPDDPANADQRGVRAQAYEYIGEAYVTLATRQGTSAADARAHRNAACGMLQRSSDVWADMRRRGILAVSDATKPEALARELDRCKKALD